MESKACKCSCQVIQFMPPPKAGSPAAMRPEGKLSPPPLPLPGRRAPARAEGKGSICGHHNSKGQPNREIFIFVMKGWVRIFKFQREKELRGTVKKGKDIFESCCGQDAPPQTAIQYYNSVRKGQLSIQMGFYDITLHLVLICIIHTECNSGCIRKQDKLVDWVMDSKDKRVSNQMQSVPEVVKEFSLKTKDKEEHNIISTLQNNKFIHHTDWVVYMREKKNPAFALIYMQAYQMANIPDTSA